MNMDTLFAEALARPEADRGAYLDAHCPDEPTRRQLARLLGAHSRAGKFLADQPDTPVGAADTHPPGQTIDDGITPELLGGRYRVTGLLGRGGMGIVYRAEQTEPLRRAVAVKVVRPGVASQFVLSRFEAERQTLAAMSHPNIATVYDGGTTTDGRPFFVMELVGGGLPITQFCTARGLPFADKLSLFLTVCDAVQHAHQRGVLHRDLKPSNVLVAEVEGKAVAKVIDFGVAKATDTGPDQVGHTRPGTLIGTPEYMSPEQADLSTRDIDVRSDVYALAVLLYELVTGDTPIPRERVKATPLLDVLHAVRNEEAPSVGAKRRGLPPELDWVLTKGLHKDRSARYPSVAAFADDLRRMTRHEAVSAAPTGGWYRVRKFVRRNWVAVSAAAAVFVSLVGGTAVSTAQMLRAQDAERVAEARRIDAERNETAAVAAKERESDQLRQAGIVVDILESAFAGLESSEKAGDLRQKLLLRLDEAERKIEADRAADPVARIRLKSVIGSVYLGMGEPGKALPVLRSLTAEATAHYGDDHLGTWQAKMALAFALAEIRKYDEAIVLYADVEPRMDRALGAAHQETVSVRVQRAIAVSRAQSWADALPLFERAYKDARDGLGDSHTLTARARLGVAGAYLHCKRTADGLALLEEQFRTTADEGRPTRLSAEVYEMTCASYIATGQHEKCPPVLKRVIAYYQADAPEHISHRRAYGQLRLAYRRVGDLPAEEGALLTLLELCRKYDGEKSFNVADTLHDLGDNRLRQKKFTEAATVLETAAWMRHELKPDGYTQYNSRRLLGQALLELKQYNKAEEQLLKAHEGLTKLRPTLGKVLDPLLDDTRRLLRELYTASGKPDEAAKWQEKDVK